MAMALGSVVSPAPRVVIAGLGGDTGKSLVTIGLLRAFSKRGYKVAPFKKGPDFIDAAWLGAAAKRPGRNLDSFLMSDEAILSSVQSASSKSQLIIVEGNRGLFDGVDAKGSHSTAHLAQLIDSPVLLVVDVTKVTRTVAALVLGCESLEPELQIGGVILNKVANARHERVIRDALALETNIPVLGAIPRLNELCLPHRHLGLVPAGEHPAMEEAIMTAADHIAACVDLDAILKLAQRAPVFSFEAQAADPDAQLSPPVTPSIKPRVRIGVARDLAFSFYYPENLEALEQAGAELVYFSPLSDEKVPSFSAMYLGGGFPEVYAEKLSANQVCRKEIARRIDEGMPVWAECGGLMYLSQALELNHVCWPMVGALPITVEQLAHPQGHGYVKGHVEHKNPFLPYGLSLSGHEFHYSRIKESDVSLNTMLSLTRGNGIGQSRDGICVKNVVASYTHLHALSVPTWALGFCAAAKGVS